MDTIPTSKEGVWSYPIRWDAYDKGTMGTKFGNWIGQKVSSQRLQGRSRGWRQAN